MDKILKTVETVAVIFAGTAIAITAMCLITFLIITR